MKKLLLILASFCCSAEYVPDNALRYKRQLTALSQNYYGIEAPVALFAAQIHKESTWREDAQSKYAQGLTQFTPQTIEHVKSRYPELITDEALNPIWFIRAMLLYDKELKTSVDAVDECNDWAFTLAMYNGGSGWIWREKNLAEAAGFNRNIWWDSVETFNAGRRDDAIRENRDYPKKILYKLQELYENNGWQSQSICLNSVKHIPHKCELK
tara:strand:+ start:603 stop:1238 length:636 start_codon:yes stop_codon:yes gene_type:complete